VEQELFVRLDVRRFRELLEAKLPEDNVRTVKCLVAECQTKPVGNDLPKIGEVTIRQIVHEVSQPLTAISNYLAACRHLTISGDRQHIEAGLTLAAEQVNRAWDIMRRLRELAGIAVQE
jgi:C4-dicarboxylate-specific signal transduction histidine kinase